MSIRVRFFEFSQHGKNGMNGQTQPIFKKILWKEINNVFFLLREINNVVANKKFKMIDDANDKSFDCLKLLMTSETNYADRYYYI